MDSSQVSATPQVPAPAAPTSLTATAGDFLVGLGWNASATASSYKVYRSITTGVFDYATPLATVTTGTSYSDTTAANSTTYFYVVRAVNAGGASASSNQASATPQVPAPAAPANPAATAGDSLVGLAWNVSTSASSYKLYRSTTSSAYNYAVPLATVTSGTSYSDTTAINGTTYFYVVRASNAGGDSASSNEVSAIPQIPAPAAPTNPAATAGDSLVGLAWNASTSASSYKVYRSTISGVFNYATPLATVTTGTSYSDTTAQNGTIYYYAIRASNAGGQSADSVQVSATPQVPAPSAPTNLSATAGNQQVSLAWNAVNGATSYSVKSGPLGGPYNTVVASNLTSASYLHTALTNETAYHYIVIASNAGGNSGSSNEASATPVPNAPDAPASLTAIAGANGVALSWYDVTGASSYQVFRSSQSGTGFTLLDTVTGTSMLDATAQAGATYFYILKAVNAGGASNASSEATCTMPPAASTTFAAVAGDGKVTLSWTALSGATSYSISRGESSAGPFSTAIATNITTLSFIDSSASNGTTYYYILTAANAGGAGNASSPVSATPQANPPSAPSAPTLSNVTASGLTATLPALPTGATVLRLQQKVAGAGDETYITYTDVTAGSPRTITGLISNTGYTFRVLAVGAGGQTAGATSSATTLEAALQGDLQIRNLNDVSYLGDDLYNLTAVGQGKSQMAQNSVAATYQVKIQNDGIQSGSFSLKGNASNANWTVKYFDALTGGTEITTSITGASGWSTGALQPGAFRELRVEVTPLVATGASQIQNVLMQVKSAGVPQDAVKASTSRAHTLVRPDMTIRLLPEERELLTTAEAAPLGLNIFNLSGAGQTRERTIWLNRMVVFEAKLLNSGASVENYYVKAPPLSSAADGWTIKYYDGVQIIAAQEITDKITSVDGWELDLAPSENGARRITIAMTPVTATNINSKAVLMKTVPRFGDESEANSDAVLAQAGMQSVGLVEWSVDQGTTWYPANGAGAQQTIPAVEQYSVVGFRASKGTLNLAWPTVPNLKPEWKISGYEGGTQKYIGTTIWVHFPTLATGNITVAAECGNSISATVLGVVTDYDVDVWSYSNSVIVGGGNDGTATITALVSNSDGAPVPNQTVRLSSKFSSGANAGTLSVAGVAGDTAVTDERGYVRITLTTGAQTGTALITAALLDAQQNTIKTSSVMNLPFVAAP